MTETKIGGYGSSESTFRSGEQEVPKFVSLTTFFFVSRQKKRREGGGVGRGSKGCTSQLDPGCRAVALPAVSSERGPLRLVSSVRVDDLNLEINYAIPKRSYLVILKTVF